MATATALLLAVAACGSGTQAPARSTYTAAQVTRLLINSHDVGTMARPYESPKQASKSIAIATESFRVSGVLLVVSVEATPSPVTAAAAAQLADRTEPVTLASGYRRTEPGIGSNCAEFDGRQKYGSSPVLDIAFSEGAFLVDMGLSTLGESARANFTAGDRALLLRAAKAQDAKLR